MTDTGTSDLDTSAQAYAEHYDEHAVRRRQEMTEFNTELAKAFGGILALRDWAQHLRNGGDCCEHEDWLYRTDAAVLDRHLAAAQDSVATAQAIHRRFPDQP